jgi:hypothetical protein
MTKTEAINYIRTAMETVLDDDYPDRMESLVDELVDEGYDEDDADELIFDTQEWVYHDDSVVNFSLSEIPLKGVRSVDLFDARGRRLFSLSVSTDGVAYQVLQAGIDAGIYTTSDDEI